MTPALRGHLAMLCSRRWWQAASRWLRLAAKPRLRPDCLERAALCAVGRHRPCGDAGDGQCHAESVVYLRWRYCWGGIFASLFR